MYKDNILYFENPFSPSWIDPFKPLWAAIIALITTSPLFTILFVFIGFEGIGILFLIQMCFFTETMMKRYQQLQRSVRIFVPFFIGLGWSILLATIYYGIKYKLLLFNKLGSYNIENIINDLKEGLFILNLFSIGLIFILTIVFLLIRSKRES